MDLRQLRYFTQVAKQGSLTNAAKKLHVAQPALSRQIRLLEQELRTKLFERYGRGMTLTEAGQRLLDRAEEILCRVATTRAEILSLGKDLMGRVCIGMPYTLAHEVAVPLAARVAEQYSRLDLSIISAATEDLIDHLHDGAIDCAVLFGPNSPLQFYTDLVLETRWALARAGSDGWIDEPGVSLHALADHPLILPGPRHSLRAQIDKLAQIYGVTISVRFEVETNILMKQFAMEGLGWTVLPVVLIEKEIAAGKLTASRILEDSFTAQLLIALPADRPATHAAAAVARMLRSVLIDVLVHDPKS